MANNMVNYKTAVFAGGCFWCMVHPFDAEKGVLKVLSGYAGGREEHPTYEQVAHGRTGHREAIEITYDPALVGYERLLEIFWRNIDPFDAQGSFVDKGHHYTTAIFAADEAERAAAKKSQAEIEKEFGKKTATAILPAAKFWPAEEYHQDFYQKNPAHYNKYRSGSGRDKKLGQLWGAKLKDKH
jgi:peptide-methionine (S)-S-oxide reductase